MLLDGNVGEMDEWIIDRIQVVVVPSRHSTGYD